MAALIVARWQRFGLAPAVAGTGIAAHLIRGGWQPIAGLPYGWYAVAGLRRLRRARRLGHADPHEPGADLLAARAGGTRRGRPGPAGGRGPRRRAGQDRPRDARRARAPAVAARHLRRRARLPARRAARAAFPRRRGGPLRGRTRPWMSCGRSSACCGTTRCPTSRRRAAGAGRRRPARPDRGVARRGHAGRGGRRRPGSATGLPDAAGRTAYRVVQEGLTNARKHAPGQPVTVTLGGGPGAGLDVSVANPPGPPRPARRPVPGTGTGLIGLTERLELAGGGWIGTRTASSGFARGCPGRRRRTGRGRRAGGRGFLRRDFARCAGAQ